MASNADLAKTAITDHGAYRRGQDHPQTERILFYTGINYRS